MKYGWLICSLLLSAGAQARSISGADIDFSDKTAYPVGADLESLDDWFGHSASFIGTDDAVVSLGAKWKNVDYSAQTVDASIEGSVLRVSGEFTFKSLATSGWTQIAYVRAHVGGSNLSGCISRNGNASEFSVGSSNNAESENFYWSDLSDITSAGTGTTKRCRLVMELTNAGSGVFNRKVWVERVDGSFTSEAYTDTGLTTLASKDLTAVGIGLGTGQSEGKGKCSDFTYYNLKSEVVLPATNVKFQILTAE